MEFVEAHIIITTKHVQLNNGIYYQLDMIPFVDQFQPTITPSVAVDYEVTNDGKTGYYIRAIRDIPLGERIYRPYPQDYSNQELMGKYGIIEWGNPTIPKVKLHYKMVKGESLNLAKSQVLGSGDMYGQYSILLESRLDDDSFKDALSVLRVQLFDDVTQIEQLLQIPIFLWEWPRSNDIPPFDSRNELKVLMELVKLIENKLSEYPRTLEGDKDALEHDIDELTQSQIFGLQITIEEKENLHLILDPLPKIIDCLTMKHADAIKAIKENKELPNHAKWYVNDVLIPLLESEIAEIGQM